jgi:hypothetical protein
VFLHPVGSKGYVVHSSRPGAKHRRTFFMFGCAWCGFHKKRNLTHYSELLFLHPVGSMGYVVHSGKSGPRNVDALFSISARTGKNCTRSASGLVVPNSYFCIHWDLWAT